MKTLNYDYPISEYPYLWALLGLYIFTKTDFLSYSNTCPSRFYCLYYMTLFPEYLIYFTLRMTVDNEPHDLLIHGSYSAS